MCVKTAIKKNNCTIKEINRMTVLVKTPEIFVTYVCMSRCTSYSLHWSFIIYQYANFSQLID